MNRREAALLRILNHNDFQYIVKNHSSLQQNTLGVLIIGLMRSFPGLNLDKISMMIAKATGFYDRCGYFDPEEFIGSNSEFQH